MIKASIWVSAFCLLSSDEQIRLRGPPNQVWLVSMPHSRNGSLVDVRNPVLGEGRNKLWFLFSSRECFRAANSHSKHISDTDRRRSVSSQSDLQSDKNTR